MQSGEKERKKNLLKIFFSPHYESLQALSTYFAHIQQAWNVVDKNFAWSDKEGTQVM